MGGDVTEGPVPTVTVSADGDTDLPAKGMKCVCLWSYLKDVDVIL